MKRISQTDLAIVSGGIVSISGYGYIVTGTSTFTLNGLGLNSAGQLYNSYTNEVFFDFSKDGDSYCLNGKLFTATPISGGYVYNIQQC